MSDLQVKFDGSQPWEEWECDLLENIRGRNEHSYQFLKGQWTILAPAKPGRKYNLPESFVAVDFPIENKFKNTSSYYTAFQFVSNFNDKVNDIYQVIRQEFAKRLSPSLLLELSNVLNQEELYDFYNNLKAKYGNLSKGMVTNADKLIQQLIKPMLTTDNFTTWITLKEQQWTKHQIGTLERIGWLIQYKDLPSQQCLLPDRLVPAIKEARIRITGEKEDEMYQLIVDILKTQDNIYQGNKSVKAESKKVQAIAKKANKNDNAKSSESKKPSTSNNNNNNQKTNSQASNNSSKKSKKQKNDNSNSTSEMQAFVPHKAHCLKCNQKFDQVMAIAVFCFKCFPDLYTNANNDNVNQQSNFKQNNYPRITSGNSTQRPVRTVTTITEDFDDNVSRDIEQLEDEEQNSQRAYLPRSQRIVRHKSIHQVSSSSVFPMLVDSGAQEHCCSEEYSHLLHNVQPYEEHNNSVKLVGAGSVPLHIISTGYYKNFPDIIYVIKNLESNLFSSTKSNLSIIQFPNNNTVSIDTTDSFGLLVNAEGLTKLLLEKDLEIDLSKYDKRSYKVVKYQNILQQAFKANIRIINTNISIPKMEKQLPIQEKVDFIVKSFLMQKKDLLLLSQRTVNFPLTSFQIEKYYRIPQEMRAGYQKMSSISTKNVTTIHDPTRDKSLAVRNLIIGEEVGSDQVGPIHGKIELLFVDKASGFALSHSENLNSLNEKSFPKLTTYTTEIIKSTDGIYRKHGHKIIKLKSDNHSIFKSKKVERLCQQLEIDQELSPSGEHRLNGLAEINVQLIKAKVISMFQLAPWIPPGLWPYLWENSINLMNLKPSRIKGHESTTRYEEFTGKVPDYKMMGVLPAGMVISATEPPINRTGPFTSKAIKCIYLCSDKLTPGAIFVFDPVTRRVFSTASYIILTYNDVDPSWKNLSVLNDNIFDNNNTKKKRVPIIESPNHPRNIPPDTLSMDQNLVPQIRLEGDKSTSPPTNLEGAKTTITSDAVLQPSVPVRVIPKLPTVKPTQELQKQFSPKIVTTPTISPKKKKSINIRVKTTTKTTPISPSVQLTPTRNTTQDNTTMYTPSGRPKRSVGSYKDGRAIDRSTEKRVNPKKVIRTIEQKIIYKIIKKNRTFDNPSYAQALSREDSDLWQTAIDAEMKQMNDENVFTIIEPKEIPTNANIIASMFVLQIKRNKLTGEIDKYKARLVALGNHQKSNSYQEISSNTIRSNTVKLLFSIQAQTHSFARVVDIKGAYLKSKIDSTKNENLVLKLPTGEYAVLNKYIYGLKQAGLEWQLNITKFLLSQGFDVTSDPLLFQKRFRNKEFIIISIHVDDLYIISPNNKLLDKFCDDIKNHYKDITVQCGDSLQYLGLAIKHDRGKNTLSVSQPAYIEKIIKECNVDVSKSALSPLQPIYVNNPNNNNKSKFEVIDTPESQVDPLYYMKLVGSLNYLATYTRPDITYALSRVSQHSQKPTHDDLLAVTRIFRYINSTKHKVLVFSVQKVFRLILMVDASYNCYVDGKSHFGFYFSMGFLNAAFCVKSGKIKITTLSSTEAEYVALANAIREALYIIRLLKDLGFYDINLPMQVHEDNAPVIDMLNSTQLLFHSTKHINPRFHFVKDLFKSKVFELVKIPTDDNVADMMTKALSVEKFRKFANEILNHYN